MVVNRHPVADSSDEDRLDWLLRDVHDNGTRRVVDRNGDAYELRQIDGSEVTETPGPRKGESIRQWLKRTLPPGEPLDDFGLRNPTRAEVDPAWMWKMSEDPFRDDDGRDDDLDATTETPARRAD